MTAAHWTLLEETSEMTSNVRLFFKVWKNILLGKKISSMLSKELLRSQDFDGWMDAVRLK